MSEAMIVTSIAVVVLSGLIAFAWYHSYMGVKGCLQSARAGEIYHFTYEQPLHGRPERYMAKIVDVYSLSEDSIRRLNRKSNYRKNDSNFCRTAHLVTAQTPDGKIRNFYAERTKNVRRPLLGGALFKSGLAAMMF